MAMTMKLLPALVAAAVAGCGGGGGGSGGETATTSIAASSMTACIDVNHNWQCDDGDASRAASATGSQGLAPKTGQVVLLESRDANNRRTRLLVSAMASDLVTGLSTLRTMLAANGKTQAEIAAIEAALSTAHGSQLESLLLAGFSEALNTYPIALAALAAYSGAVAAQSNAQPTLAIYAPTLGGSSTDVTWVSTEAGTVRRQLSAQSSIVLNNSETNRLYLFDASASSVTSREIDLVPPPPPVLASYPKLVRRTLAALDKALSVFVDSASAATAFANPPTGGTPVALEPGKGIAGIQLVDGGNSAFVLLNMLSGKSTTGDCVGTVDGTDGLFKIDLTDAASYRALKGASACVHSGFSLIAADAAGTRVAAWDAAAKQLWLLDGATMQKIASVDLKFDADKPPQALAFTPGGRYLAAAGYGRVTLVDTTTGRLISQLSGDWGNVAQIGFAGGARRLLVASDALVHTVRLDDRLQLIGKSAETVNTDGETLRALAVAADGDSYVATSDARVYWRTTATSAALGSSTLPSGLSVQQATLAGRRMVVLARGAQDQQFKLLRLPIGLPASPAL